MARDWSALSVYDVRELLSQLDDAERAEALAFLETARVDTAQKAMREELTRLLYMAENLVLNIAINEMSNFLWDNDRKSDRSRRESQRKRIHQHFEATAERISRAIAGGEYYAAEGVDRQD